MIKAHDDNDNSIILIFIIINFYIMIINFRVKKNIYLNNNFYI